ncbi:hypothetical protein BKA01_000124 [Pseudonocardia eucalypti]|nr:hypothetical protein [Pseudonocardia eucalypti]
MFHVKQAKSANPEDRPENQTTTDQSVVDGGKTVTELAPHAELASDAGRVVSGVATMGEVQAGEWLRDFSPARSGSRGPGSVVLSAPADPATHRGHPADPARPGRGALVGEGYRATGSAELSGRVTDPAAWDGGVTGPAAPNGRLTGAARLNNGAPEPGNGCSEAIGLAALSGRTSNLAARTFERSADRGVDQDDVLAAAAMRSQSSPDLAEPIDRALTWFASTTAAAGASEPDSVLADRAEPVGRPRDLSGPIAASTGVSCRPRTVRALRRGTCNFLNRRCPPAEPMARSSHPPDETTQARRLPEQATRPNRLAEKRPHGGVRPRKRTRCAV